MKRCKAKTVWLGENLRCEAQAGHDSVHYCGKTWWPNRDGFPYPKNTQRKVVAIAWAVAMAVLIGAIIYMLVTK